MQYFFDHETDAVSIVFTEFLDYAATEVIGQGVVMYVDGRKRPLAVELRNASTVMDTNGLTPMFERAISTTEVAQRLSVTTLGQSLTKILTRRSEAMGAPR